MGRRKQGENARRLAVQRAPCDLGIGSEEDPFVRDFQAAAKPTRASPFGKSPLQIVKCRHQTPPRDGLEDLASA